MPIPFDPDVIAKFISGNIGQRNYLIDFEFDSGTLRFTTIPNGTTYLGNDYTFLGAIGSVGTVSENEDLDPAQYEIIIGSTDESVLGAFLGGPTLNRRVKCYQVLTNDDQSFVESVEDAGPWTYFVGSMQPALIDDGEQPTITISIRDELADWDRNITSLYTDAEQQRLHPGDFCLENISQLATAELIWPTSALQKAQA